MVIAIDPNATRDVILAADKDSENPTIFRIGVFDSALRAYVLDQGRADRNGDSANMLAVLTLAVKFGLKGWDNFRDAAGQDIPFSTVSIAIPGIGNREGLAPRSLDFLGPYVFEIGREIVNFNVLTPTETKNSDGPSK